ncbi:hypothetical protein E4U61_005588 [Claviceps capensis]|nr:hypothetical protein E4U61_005588 [Claviceps capensis]
MPEVGTKKCITPKPIADVVSVQRDLDAEQHFLHLASGPFHVLTTAPAQHNVDEAELSRDPYSVALDARLGGYSEFRRTSESLGEPKGEPKWQLSSTSER